MENDKKKNILNHATVIAIIGTVISILIMNTSPEMAVLLFIFFLAYYFFTKGRNDSF